MRASGSRGISNNATATTNKPLVLVLVLLLLVLPLSLARAEQQQAQPAADACSVLESMDDLPADRLAELAATAQALVAPGKGILVSVSFLCV